MVLGFIRAATVALDPGFECVIIQL
jgi:hypothetical protein